MAVLTTISQDGPRADGASNVFWDGKSSLRCFWTNDLVKPSRYGNYNIWTATNEDPTPRFIEKIGYLEVYKFKDYNTCLTFCNWKRKQMGMELETAMSDELKNLFERSRDYLFDILINNLINNTGGPATNNSNLINNASANDKSDFDLKVDTSHWLLQQPYLSGTYLTTLYDQFNNKIYFGYVLLKKDEKIQNNTIHRNVREYMHGVGISYFPEDPGSYLRGFFLFDSLNGKGELHTSKYHYIGQWQNGIKSGSGKEWVLNDKGTVSSTYEGNFGNNTYNGLGKLQTDNFIYEGNFLNGKFSGTGKMTFLKKTTPNKEYYKGSFQDGSYNGYGEYYFANGDNYRGQFANGSYNGKGTFYFAITNITQEGFYQNNIYLGLTNQKPSDANGSIGTNNSTKEILTQNRNKFPDSELSDLNVDGKSMKYMIEDLFGNMFAQINVLQFWFGKSAVSQKDILSETKKIKNQVEEWLGGPMTSAQISEFNQIAKYQATFHLSMDLSKLLNSSASSSTSRQNSNSIKCNANQCLRCGKLVIDEHPSAGKYGYDISRDGYKESHKWWSATPNPKYQCSKCGMMSYLCSQSPSDYDFGPCSNAGYSPGHHWNKL